MTETSLEALVEKEDYVLAVREVLKEARDSERTIDRPWRLGLLGGAKPAWIRRHRDYLERLRALTPPPGDAEDVRRYFLDPFEVRIQRVEEGADERWPRPSRAPECEQDLSGAAFQASYGLADPGDWSFEASFAERAAAVGLDPLPALPLSEPLDPRRIRILAWSRRGRWLRRTLRGSDRREVAICVALKVSRGWAAFLVPEHSPNSPMAMLLTKAPRRPWRGHPTIVVLHGTSRPGGNFVVEFPDRSLALPKTCPHLSRWPPAQPKSVAGLIVA